MSWRRRTIFGLICAAPLTASAATLTLNGNYGSDAGCRVARTGSYEPNDDVFLLTPDSVGTAVTLCSFNSVQTAPDGGQKVTLTCASEGEGPEGNSQDKAEITGDPTAGYTIRFTDGSTWGPLTKCS